ncbi:calcium-binding protein [Pseudovibrio sp. Alg231-02]|uniref:calcium-binding protein n=1 Tax=Pseudovibrio sp. Alg231-02 TaxID=1922223 RepID=UPI00131EE7C3|nr:calcium-binding protein [Pseudovibrio sp. Alg231-02]
MALILGTTAADFLYGTIHNDKIYGYSGDDLIFATGGNNLIYAGIGNDTVFSGGGSDTLYGGSGRDEVVYATLREGVGVTVNLQSGRSFYSKTGARDTLYDFEDVTGTIYSDFLTGDNGANTLTGNGGDDYIYGMRGDDTLYGGSGNDYIYGGSGLDKLYGGSGNDTMVDFGANTIFDGGRGNDTVSYSTLHLTGLFVNLSEGKAEFGKRTQTLASIENVSGSDHGDVILGNEANNVLKGYNGSDILFGQKGDDYLDGGNGNDYLEGGYGNDVLRGGPASDSAAKDRFVFSALSPSDNTGHDVILDFDQTDVVDIHQHRAAYSWSGFSEILEHMRIDGNDVILELGSGSVRFENWDIDNFREDMFIL